MQLNTGGTDILEGGYPITVQEVKKFLKDNSITPEPGDAMFFHTGASSKFSNPGKYDKFYDSSAGIGYELARYLNELKISVTGSDTPSSEVVPPEDRNTRLPVHQYLIAKAGIHIFRCFHFFTPEKPVELLSIKSALQGLG